MSCSVGVAQYAIKDLLLNFLRDNPKVELVQQVTNQSVDLVSFGIDLAIRGHIEPLPDSSNIQRPLTTVYWHLFASPSYLTQKGIPESPYDLFNQRCLKVGWQPATGNWLLENTQGVKTSIPFTPHLCSDDMHTLIHAATNGLGIVSLPAYTVRNEVASGRLVRVLPSWTTGRAQLSLLSPSRRISSAAVRALSDYLVANMGKEVGDS